MFSRLSGAARAVGTAIRALSALQANLGNLNSTTVPISLCSFSNGYSILPLSVWQHQCVRCLSIDAAAAVDTRLAEYRVEIVTGDVRGAGSAAPAVIVLIGEDGESEPLLIGGGDEEEDGSVGFGRATRKTYRLYSKELGQLRRLYVRQLSSVSNNPGAGWYLDRIEVRGPLGETWAFPCTSWIGRSEGGEEHAGMVSERTLLPVDLAALSSFEARQFVNLNPLFAPLHATSSGVAVPHPEKVAEGLKGVNRKGYGYAGEDSYFYCSNRNGVFAMGVSDGVYAWREKGIDAGLYSQKLMEYARLSVSMGTTDVLRVIQYAAKRVQRERIKGSATCCVVLVDLLQGRMASANIGDSGIMVIGPRSDTSSEWPVYTPPGSKVPLVVKYHSPQQEHAFGRPYQLGHHEYADSADDAMLSTLPVGPGDIMLLGSDGLFDNMGEEEIRAEVERMFHRGAKPAAISQQLVQLAFQHSLDRGRQTPYSLGASEAFDMVYSGGKADDISVICALFQ